MKTPLTIALVGNPNTGKSTIFNALTGLRQKIANYPGITVERKAGTTIINGVLHQIVDLPGAYSLNYAKLDEKVTYEALIGSFEYEEVPDVILAVVDATNLERNLFLVTQVIDLEIPVILVLNMMDEAKAKGISVDSEVLQKNLGVPVIPISAKDKNDIERLKNVISDYEPSSSTSLNWLKDQDLKEAIELVKTEWIATSTNIPERAQDIEALRLISEGEFIGAFYEYENAELGKKIISKVRAIIEKNGGNPLAVEVMQRYDYIGECATKVVDQRVQKAKNLTDRIDAVVTHKIAGPVIFALVLLVMFQSIFSWATPFMDFIDLIFVQFGSWVAQTLPEGMLNDLLVEGVIAGLGGVVIFLPQIIFLFLFIYTLEGTGYMARAAFVMDGFMTKVGLHGRSVVPMMSGFACAIPGIMAARSIENWRDRIITIMVLPFMACSARLPVYALLIAAFVPDTIVLGIFTWQGITFFGLYIFGILIAILAAAVMKKMFPSGKQTPFIMELPSYKMPKWSIVIRNSLDRGRVFVVEAGKVIVALSIVLWFLASFPKVGMDDFEANAFEQESLESYELRQSFAGKFGQVIEPAIQPLGFDWKIGIGLLTSFAAREVMVGTLSTIYSIEGGEEDIASLTDKLRNDTYPETGLPVFTLATALSLMIFFALAMQCMSTIAIVRRETNSWKWPVAMFSYMTILAYICSFITYQTVSLF